MIKNFRYIQKNGALCTCFMDAIMIFISLPETPHFVVVIEYHVWLHAVGVFIVLHGVHKLYVHGFTQFLLFLFYLFILICA